MLILVKRLDKNYGGYDYVEIDTSDKVYSKGNSRGHRGHGSSSLVEGGSWLDIKVSTSKELNNIIEDLERQDFTKVPNMFDYQEIK